MSRGTDWEAVVVGSGPNGLAAAVTLARAGCRVLVLEAKATIGGGTRSSALTLPGYVHDVCSSIHPLAVASPFFRELSLEAHGLKWIHPRYAVAHPLDGRRASVVSMSLSATSARLGVDGPSYRDLTEGFVDRWRDLVQEILQPWIHLPKSPGLLARFAAVAMRSATALATARFRTEEARSLFAGLAAHSLLPLDQLPSAAIGLVLAIAGHAVGWPMPERGAQSIADALAAVLRAAGGHIQTQSEVTRLDSLPSSRAVLLDITPRQFVAIAGTRLPARYRDRLLRFRYGPGTFKIDYALSAPIPWLAPDCGQAGTVHLGGSLAEIAAAEREVARGDPPEAPFVLLAQHSLFDSTRAPADRHTAWAYCHVPNGSTFDMMERIERQIERFAPGFRDCVLARHVHTPRTFEATNSNLIGGDIGGGLADLRQLVARPTLQIHPYRTPLKGVYLCSASTPPGAGVHGMCGYHAARSALRDLF